MFGTVRYTVFFGIELKSRAVHIAGMRIDPDGAWMMQMARNLLDPVDGFLRNATHLIHDRDPTFFTKAWVALLNSSGVKGHYLTERFHQGLGGQLIVPRQVSDNDNSATGAIRCRSRLGGLLNFYQREAA